MIPDFEPALCGASGFPRRWLRVRVPGVHQNASDTKVDYCLRKTGEGRRGIDIIIEGLSLVQNFRSQAQEIISAEGADALIQKLRNKQIDLEAGVEKS